MIINLCCFLNVLVVFFFLSNPYFSGYALILYEYSFILFCIIISLKSFSLQDSTSESVDQAAEFSQVDMCSLSQEYLTLLTNVKYFAEPYSISEAANCLFDAGQRFRCFRWRGENGDGGSGEWRRVFLLHVCSYIEGLTFQFFDFFYAQESDAEGKISPAQVQHYLTWNIVLEYCILAFNEQALCNFFCMCIVGPN